MELKDREQKGVERIRVAQDKYKWQDLDNTVEKLGVPQNAGSCSTG